MHYSSTSLTVFLMALLQALQWCCEPSLMSESFGARLEVVLVVLLLVFIFSLCSTSLLECWWFGHVQRRPPDAPVRSGILSQDSNMKRGRGRPKLTWVEAIKGDLKEWNIPKDLALDRSAWKTAIHVPEPWLLLMGFNSSLPQLVWDLKALLLLLLLNLLDRVI